MKEFIELFPPQYQLPVLGFILFSGLILLLLLVYAVVFSLTNNWKISFWPPRLSPTKDVWGEPEINKNPWPEAARETFEMAIKEIKRIDLSAPQNTFGTVQPNRPPPATKRSKLSLDPEQIGFDPEFIPEIREMERLKRIHKTAQTTVLYGSHRLMGPCVLKYSKSLTLESIVNKSKDIYNLLNQNRIIRCHEFPNNEFGFLFRYQKGLNLFEYVRVHGKLRGPDLERMVMDLISELSQLHMHKIVHRDINPKNVIFDKETNSFVLIDLEDACREADKQTPFAAEGYAAVEQLRGEARMGSDLYSLAATIYYASTGRIPPKPEDQGNFEEIVSGGKNRHCLIEETALQGTSSYFRKYYGYDILNSFFSKDITSRPTSALSILEVSGNSLEPADVHKYTVYDEKDFEGSKDYREPESSVMIISSMVDYSKMPSLPISDQNQLEAKDEDDQKSGIELEMEDVSPAEVVVSDDQISELLLPQTEIMRVEKRKSEVLKLARKGMTSSEIARRLRISADQIEFFIRIGIERK